MPAGGVSQHAAGRPYIGFAWRGNGKGSNTKKNSRQEASQEAKQAAQGGILQFERDRGAPIVKESAWNVRAHVSVGRIFDRGNRMMPAFVKEIRPAFGIFPLRQPGTALLCQQLRLRIDRFEDNPEHVSSSVMKSMRRS